MYSPGAKRPSRMLAALVLVRFQTPQTRPLTLLTQCAVYQLAGSLATIVLAVEPNITARNGVRLQPADDFGRYLWWGNPGLGIVLALFQLYMNSTRSSRILRFAVRRLHFLLLILEVLPRSYFTLQPIPFYLAVTGMSIYLTVKLSQSIDALKPYLDSTAYGLLITGTIGNALMSFGLVRLQQSRQAGLKCFSWRLFQLTLAIVSLRYALSTSLYAMIR